MNNNCNIDNHIDDSVDAEIYECIKLENSKSFFLFAGAGSGKTRSLVKVLQKFKENDGKKLNLYNQKVAIITYTNAACDEIKRRLEYDSLFWVSTIHSFAWELIKPYQNDIRDWLKNELTKQTEELTISIDKSKRIDTKEKRRRELKEKTKRLDNLSKIRIFSYNPNGDNFSKDSLNHSEVINICTSFIDTKMIMQKILISKFPIVFIDESQDTNKNLIEALFKVEEQHYKNFSLGLFGDVMQRIYFDGKSDLGKSLPTGWKSPIKKMNHRCSKRVVKLINQIRKEVDGIEQYPRSDKEEGFVRFFIIPSNTSLNKKNLENKIIEYMQSETDDKGWEDNEIKVLTLEHHLVAVRMGFSKFFNSLYSQNSLKNGLLDGSLSEIKFFSSIIIPLVNAHKDKNDFEIYRILKGYSPKFSIENLRSQKSQVELIKEVKQKIDNFFNLWNEGNPTLITILKFCEESKLFDLPNNFKRLLVEINQKDFSSNKLSDDKLLLAWYEALQVNYEEIILYNQYISNEASFGTHQGVKGLEFPRVMVILDDEEAKGFMFSYEKLFGAKELTKTDITNIQQGKDSSIDRTRRLFYVTCSRAEKSLAIVAYTSNPSKVKQQVTLKKWFDKNEIKMWSNNKFV